MIQDMHTIFAYAITAAALVVLLSSTTRISLAILSENTGAAEFNVNLDDQGVFIGEDKPILPINQRKLAVKKGDSGPGGVSDVLPKLMQMSSETRKIDESNLPYRCGVILYDHHVPGEGGDALNEWIKQLVASKDGSSFISSGEHESKELFKSEVEMKIEGIGPSDWKVIHSHKNGLAFRMDENVLRSWRDTVERQNCQFIAAVIFADPLDHSMKHTKKLFADCNCGIHDFKEKLLDDVASNNAWTGQLDHFLFNFEDAPTVEMKDKVKKGMQLLKDHFEVVLVDGKGDFTEEIVRITGWKTSSQVKKASISDGGLVYSKNLVSGYGKMSTKNGDVDFMDAVNHVYYGSLAYLMMQ